MKTGAKAFLAAVLALLRPLSSAGASIVGLDETLSDYLDVGDVRYSFSIEVGALLPYGAETLEMMGGVLRHIRVAASETEEESAISLLVDGESVMDLTQRRTADGTALTTALLPNRTLVSDGSPLDLLMDNETEEAAFDALAAIREVEGCYQTLTDANRPYIVETLEKTHDLVMAGDIVISDTVVYNCRVDTYAVGVKRIDLSPSAYQNLVDYEEENGIAGTADSIIKPSVDHETYLTDYADHLRGNGVIDTLVTTIINEMRTYYENNPGIYYALSAYPDNDETQQPSDKSNMFSPIYDENGNVKDLYIRDDAGDLVYGTYGQGRYTLRVDYFDYSTYFNGFEPYLFFGANAEGRDIFLRLAEGARFSLILGVCISLINFIIGLIWGAVSGYYGGTADLVMERVTDIIGNVPSIVVLTICSVSFTSNGAMMGKLGSAGVLIVSILLAFVYSGWIGTASTTRMQFYRYKGQEYVLASRTLGAKDRRLIFRHILPNAAGTLVTSSVLLVPGVIFSETSLSYLGLINFTTSGLCSIGSLLNEGQTAGLANYPHMLLFPCIVISLLMICFNLFGNGLRDAFNTTLKGAED